MHIPGFRRLRLFRSRFAGGATAICVALAGVVAVSAAPLVLHTDKNRQSGPNPVRPEGAQPVSVTSGPARIVPAALAVPVPAPAHQTAGEPPPNWRRLGVPAAAAEGRPTITIMIDDMGVNRVQSDRAVRLPAPLTLSWMPYAVNVTDQAAIGAAHGHETMLHMNMEPLGRTDPGPDALRTWLPPATNLAYLRRALDLVPGAVGLNQHEGSVASLSVPLMDLVMGELKARGLLFVDSLVIPHSVSLRRAHAAGIAAVPRDVFLDNSPDPHAIRAQLAAMEAIARHSGHVIAIGHPRQSTVDVLAAYLPSVASRGFVLWPVSATVAASNSPQMAQQPQAPE